MVGKKCIAWYRCLPLVLLAGCVGDAGPTPVGNPVNKPAAIRNAPEPSPAPVKKPTEAATAPDTAEKPAAPPPATQPPPAAPKETKEVKDTGEAKEAKSAQDTKNAKAAAEPPKPVERRDIPGENRARTPDLRADGIHDPTSPALPNMQNPSQSLSALPLGRWGEIDWMQALNRKSIRPRANIKTEGAMEVLDLDIVMTNTKTMPHVRFPHSSHTQWLACSNCHPTPFVAQKGGNTMPMDSILKGKFCGMCHGKVAFSIYICQRCHNVVHEGSPEKWW